MTDLERAALLYLIVFAGGILAAMGIDFLNGWSLE